MAILTKQSVTKGTPATFTLGKSDLATLISGDAYFQDTANWKTVVMNYKSTVGGQKKKVIFDATSGATPASQLLLSLKARNAFEIQSIIIYDFDGGKKVIARTALTTSQFDVSIATGGATEDVLWTIVNGTYLDSFGSDGGLERIGGNAEWDLVAANSGAISGDFELEAVIERLAASGTYALRFGYQKTNTIPAGGANPTMGFRLDQGTGNIIVNEVGASSNSQFDMAYQDIKTFVIKRVGSAVTLVINGGTPIALETYSGDIYPHAAIYNGYRFNSVKTTVADGVAIVWNDHSQFTEEADGGLEALSGANGSSFIKSTASGVLSGDFEYEFVFYQPGTTTGDTYGISSSDADNNYTGLYGVVTYTHGQDIHVNSSGTGGGNQSQPNPILLNQNNTFNIKRVAGTLTMTMNGVVLDIRSHSVDPVYPLARIYYGLGGYLVSAKKM